MKIMRTLRRCVLYVVIGLGAAISLAQPSAAQDGDEAALRQLQAKQFAAMFAAPDDLDLMYAYALTSVRLLDYEAAISTLERILIFRPDTPRIEVELGAAYYRIGSYTIARFYFEEAKDDPTTPPELIIRADAFLAEIDNRTQTSSFVGSASVNMIVTSNANNGPESRLIDLSGLRVRLTGPNVTSQPDIGASVSLQATHIYDLQGMNEDTWRTNVSLYSARFESTRAGAADVAILRTGPQLGLDDDRHGPKIRPYVEVDHVRSSEDALYSTVGVGAEFTNTLDAKRALFTDLRIGWRDYHNDGVQNLDGVQIRSLAGLNYFHSDALLLRGLVLFEYDGAATRSQRAVEYGVGASAQYSYDSGLDFAGRLWSVTANAIVLRRDHFQQDSVALVRRQDTDLRLSLGHTAHLESGLALTVRGDYFRRFSNSRNFRLESFSMNFGLTYFF